MGSYMVVCAAGRREMGVVCPGLHGRSSACRLRPDDGDGPAARGGAERERGQKKESVAESEADGLCLCGGKSA